MTQTVSIPTDMDAARPENQETILLSGEETPEMEGLKAAPETRLYGESADCGMEEKKEARQDAPASCEEAPANQEMSNKEVTDRTANMWNYLPIPENEPEPTPEYKISDVSYPGAHVFGSSVRGKKHKHEGSCGDDWFETAHYEDVTFAAVSDGAGSRKLSRIGARESCKAAVGYLMNEFPEMIASCPDFRVNLQLPLTDERCVAACGRIADLIQRSVIQAWNAVESAYYSRSTDPRYADLLQRKPVLSDFGGTLLVSVIVPIQKETKEQLVVSCQIGDGMTAVVNTGGPFPSSVKLLGVPDSGEFTGETEFLTSPKMKQIDQLQKRTKLFRGPADVVMMMSDGVADDYFPNETQMRRLYYDLVANGILHTESEDKKLSDLSPEQMSLLKKIPDPIAYPWVNDRTILVPIQYTKRICEAMKLSLEDLWKQREILALASLELTGREHLTSDGARLNQWLDNYYERASFDDRTLVVIQLQEG